MAKAMRGGQMVTWPPGHARVTVPSAESCCPDYPFFTTGSGPAAPPFPMVLISSADSPPALAFDFGACISQ